MQYNTEYHIYEECRGYGELLELYSEGKYKLLNLKFL